MKECTHQDILNWFLCENARRRPADFWYTCGHPCRFSHQEFAGEITCTYQDTERTETRQE